MSRHGTGKAAVLSCIALDHAMSEFNTLHAVYGKSVNDIRAFDDEVLNAMIEHYGIEDRARVMTTVERHKQIYTYRDGEFSAVRLGGTLAFLKEHAQFQPHIIEIQGWPSFRSIDPEEIRALSTLAKDFETEIWLSAHTHRAPG